MAYYNYNRSNYYASDMENTGAPIYFYKIDVDLFLDDKEYIGFFAYTNNKIYTPIKTTKGKDYMLVSASFTGFSTGQNTLYIKNTKIIKEGGIGSILPKRLFSIVEEIIYCYNEKLGITNKEIPKVGLDDKLFTIED